MANIRLATTDRYKDKASGEFKEATEWHRVSFFGRLAEIVADRMQMLGGRNGGGQREPRGDDDFESPPQGRSEQSAREQQRAPAATGTRSRPPQSSAGGGAGMRVPSGGGFDPLDDDIPFLEAYPRAAWAAI